jgi:hypothetical protein
VDALSVRHARTSLTSTAEAIVVSLGCRFRGPAGTGPHPAFPREGERVPPHPRCLPSPVSPCRGSPRPPQAVPSLWIDGADAFSIHALSLAFDEAWGNARSRSCLCVTGLKGRAHHHIDRSASERLLRSV